MKPTKDKRKPATIIAELRRHLAKEQRKGIIYLTPLGE